MKKGPVGGPPAGFWMRVGAAVMDMVILGVTVPIFGIIAAIVIPLAAHSGSKDAMGGVVETILFAFLFVVPCLYYTLSTGLTGQTLGKKIFNLTVVKTDGTTISVFHAFLRWLSYLVSSIPFGIGYLFPAFQKDKRALHDLVCGTKVVQSGPSNQVALIVILCVFPFASVFVIGILAAIAIPRFAQMLEKSREGATKGNLGSIESAVSIYYGDNGKYPADLEKDLVPKYLAVIPPVKATGAFVSGAESPAGNNVSMAQKGQVPTESSYGWLYDSNFGKVYVNSTVKDSKGVPYSFYGFE